VNVLDEIVADQIRTDLPELATGDTVRVAARVVEGGKDRIHVDHGFGDAAAGLRIFQAQEFYPLIAFLDDDGVPVATWVREFAARFHGFYRDCRVFGATPETVESFRAALSVAAQTTIALSLGLLGVSAPTSM